MTHALDEAAQRVSRYLLLQFAVNVCYGLVVSLVLHLIGIPNALLWGVGAGILRFLPYVGPPIGAALPILLSLAVFDGWSKAIFTIGFFVAIEIVVSNFVEPSLYGAHTGISPLAILFAAVFWTLVWGPIGLVLSTPLTVCLVVMGRHVPHLEFLQVILGDDPVLPPEAMFYQRLLATDLNEARQIMEAYLKNHSLTELYDTVLIPALSLAEQDRHRDDLDEVTELFIAQSVKELVEEANDRADELHQQSSESSKDTLVAETEKAESDSKQEKAEEKEDAKSAKDWDVPATASALQLRGTAIAAPQVKSDNRETLVTCMPARDEADEIVGTMLAHLLERAGYRAHYLEIGTSAEMLALVAERKPAVVCISALPPFAMAHSRRLYRSLRAQSPDLKIVVGLWDGAVDPNRTPIRISGVADSQVSRNLAQAVLQVKLLIEGPPKTAETQA
jgi:methanogenic corrinoid protein MtbC1